MNYVIKRSALTDLKDIARYTRKTWGREQEQIYIQCIFDAFEKIATRDAFTVECSHIKAGCLKCKVNHHLIFFQWLTDGRPEIIRILHEEMDIPMQLAITK